jgi:hypothetical protein
LTTFLGHSSLYRDFQDESRSDLNIFAFSAFFCGTIARCRRMPASWTVVEVVPWHSDILFPSVAKQMISSIYVGSDVLADDVSGDPLAHFLLYLIRRCSRESNVPDAMRADEAASRRLLGYHWTRGQAFRRAVLQCNGGTKA